MPPADLHRVCSRARPFTHPCTSLSPTIIRAQYEQHYAELALRQLEQALQQKQLLAERLPGGAAELDRLLAQRKGMALLAADCLLQRDRAAAAIASTRRKQAENQIDCPDGED